MNKIVKWNLTKQVLGMFAQTDIKIDSKTTIIKIKWYGTGVSR